MAIVDKILRAMVIESEKNSVFLVSELLVVA